MAMNIRVPEELDARLTALAGELHVSKSALLLQGAQLVIERYDRRAEVADGLDFILGHDAALLHRLEDA